MESAIKFLTRWKETIEKMILYYLATVLKELRFILEPLVRWLGPEKKITGILKDDRSESGCITWGELVEICAKINMRSVSLMMSNCLGEIAAYEYRAKSGGHNLLTETIFYFFRALSDLGREICPRIEYGSERPIAETLPTMPVAEGYSVRLRDYNSVITSLSEP